jgi:2Fe-2S ferredoxin
VIDNLGKKEVSAGLPSRTVLFHLHSAYVDWMHSCGGKGNCTTCKMEVLEGHDHLSPLSAAETLFRQKGQLHSRERLACQVRIMGPVVIRVPDETKLPHISYTY